MPKASDLKTFKVEGKWPFPIDMLRYDMCWPYRSKDSANIEASIRPLERLPDGSYSTHLTCTVMLQTFHNVELTKSRWLSFMWRVVS